MSPLSWHCPCSHWSMNAFTLARTSKLLFGPRTHFVRVFVEQTGRLWRSLGPEPQKDARPASKWTQCGHIKLRKHLWSWGCKGTPPRRLHNTGATRKVSVFNGAQILLVSQTHAHTQLDLEQLMSILAANYCSSCSAAERKSLPPTFILCWVSKSDLPHDEASSPRCAGAGERIFFFLKKKKGKKGFIKPPTFSKNWF